VVDSPLSGQILPLKHATVPQHFLISKPKASLGWLNVAVTPELKMPYRMAYCMNKVKLGSGFRVQGYLLLQPS
jgi:hypothetical protein